MHKLIRASDWAEIVYIESDEEALQTSSNLWIRLVGWLNGCRKFTRNARDLLSVYQPFSYVFLGNYSMPGQLHLANASGSGRIVALDDGSLTLITAKLRKSKTRVYSMYGFQEFCKCMIRQWIYGYKICAPASVTFFTAFKIAPAKEDSVIINHYALLRASVGQKTVTNEVYFLGSRLVSRKLLGIPEFFQLMSRVRNFFPEREITYIRHPAERLHDVDSVLLDLRFKIADIDGPVEAELALMPVIPSTIAGFYSTAIYNLWQIFGNRLEYFSFRLPNSCLCTPNTSNIEQVYAHMERACYGISVIDFKLLPPNSTGF